MSGAPPELLQVPVVDVLGDLGPSRGAYARPVGGQLHIYIYIHTYVYIYMNTNDFLIHSFV